MNLIAPLADFSRANCVGICAFLVPMMLVFTLGSLGVAYRQWGRAWARLAYGGTIAACLMMGLHVVSWFSIGVVTPITFILLGLALTCCTVSTLVWALPALPQRLGKMVSA